MRFIKTSFATALVTFTSLTGIAAAESATWTIIYGGNVVGDMVVETNDGLSFTVDYEYRNNGRGPTMLEKFRLDEETGLPVMWTIDGNTTFGNKIEERFSVSDGTVSWTDSTGSSEVAVEELDGPTIYVAQEGTPYALWVYASALMKDEDRAMPALPGGTLRLDEIQTVTVNQDEVNDRDVTAYALMGTDLDPTYFLMDDDEFFGVFTPDFLIIREGYEQNREMLNELATELSAQRYADIQAKVAHDYDKPVRIENVHLFEPEAMELTDLMDVVVEGNTITGVYTAATEFDDDAVVIDGAGGTLMPGIWDMHGHVGQDDALLNIAAGVTSIRDMGNNNEVLADLIAKIEAGTVAGPRIVRSGFIEGKSEFNSNNGILVTNQEEAVAAVDTYADMGFWQIKIYNSMKGEWVPAMIERAHERGLRVTGHVPAFSNADQMIEAGYDEMTHINQIMLGFVLDEGEDTRTLLRLTALKRLEDLNLNSPEVQHTIEMMAARDVAIDPTLAIHEALLLGRNGETRIGTLDYIDHMPVGIQRSARVAWSDISSEADDIAYRAAYDKIVSTVSMMREAGIFIVFGTDMGGAFNQHREMEIYEQAGFTKGEILRRATYDMAVYMDQLDELGSIEEGKLADFFLMPGNPLEDLRAIKTISMVISNGTVYYPTEIYEEVGIEPFTDIPAISQN
ncbi:amidohydrolase family protein [Parvularcula flava]|uniref:Amidohydrolase family protein n=1 Tax=Aquisalinus luteolus TaxID=1566827 RepID=A0A8J3A9N4_9PROT|nr:amidohydrolase family protein [Aquisalinus luteolus]NHK28837.1 amidohydrolase family protein [Aquisalinus luteolus]GGH99666.1 hypothetical protein GCM10011355_26160 [Aquisalinus luteolus]